MSDTGVLDADRALKAKHQAMWALGNYPAVAADVIADTGVALVAYSGVGRGDRVLDVAAGSGNAAIPAAVTGARVVASDLTPELLAAGERLAEARGVTLDWRRADAESLPFDDDEFDVVLSCVGVMFAPHHQAAADELIRVCRPGGRIAVLNWTPEGFIGQLFATMKPYAPPPAPGSQPPPLWGRQEHVEGLFGDRVTELNVQRAVLTVDAFSEPEHFLTYWKSHYGPTIATYRSIAGEPDRVAALDHELTDLARRQGSTGDPARWTMDWEYLMVRGTKRG